MSLCRSCRSRPSPGRDGWRFQKGRLGHSSGRAPVSSVAAGGKDHTMGKGRLELWANLFLLFWLSLVPFAIRWMDETGFTALPTAAYGIVLAMAAFGYTLLQRTIIACNGRSSRLAAALGSDLKGKISFCLYVIAIPLAFLRPWIAIVLYVVVALMWFVPDRRIESTRDAMRVGDQSR